MHRQIILLTAAFHLAAMSAWGQLGPLSTIDTITVTDASGASRKLVFGGALCATYGIDGLIAPGLEEVEIPPPLPPPGIFEANFIDHRTPGVLGTGLYVHIQELFKLDTFRIDFSRSAPSGFPITLSWNFDGRLDFHEARLQDLFGGLFFTVEMLRESSYVVTNPLIGLVQIIARFGECECLYVGCPPCECTVSDVPALDRGSSDLSREVSLEQNYPNPFNPSTTISYGLPVTAHVVIELHDMLGRKVATLRDGPEPAGTHEVTFEGSELPSGIYALRLSAAGETKVRKIVLLR